MEKDSRKRYMMTPEPWSKWEIRNLSKTKFLCQHSRWLFTQGRRHHCCHAGCIAGLGAGGNGQEGQEILCTFVTTGIVNITIQWRNSTFKRGFQSSNRSRQSRKPVKKKPVHMCALFYTAEVFLTVLYCSWKGALWRRAVDASVSFITTP